MRIIHFFTDEKFTDFVVYLFKQFADLEQKYVLVKREKDQKINFKYNELEYILLNEVNDYVKEFKADCVIFHSLFNFNLKVLNELNTKAKVCWYSWGGDLALDPVKPFKNVHEPVTFQKYYHFNTLSSLKNKFIDIVKSCAPSLFNKYIKFRTGEEWQYFVLKKNLSKINIVNTVTFSEHDIFRKHNFKGRLIHIPIGTIGLLLEHVDINKQADSLKKKYPTVFLGHSAYSENNQFDVLKSLRDMNFKGEIICPVSYGSKDYAQKLVEYGEQLFDGQFKPINRFLPQNQYFELLQSADYYLNNSIIQQGLGNIIAALYIGKPVFINKKGKGYEYLKQMGIQTYTIQDDLGLCNNFFEYKNDLKSIRDNIDSVYLEKNVINKLKNFISELAQ